MPTNEQATRKYWSDWVRRAIGGNELVQDAASNAAFQQINEGKDEAAAAAAAYRMAESLGVASARPNRPLACRLCGSTPAANVTIREHNGRIVFMVLKRQSGPFCRDCGLALFRQHQNSTLYQGWFGFISFFITPITLLANVFAWLKLRSLAQPHRDPTVKSAIPGPLSPGKPLFRRHGPYIAGVLLGVLGLLILKPGAPSPSDTNALQTPIPYSATPTASPTPSQRATAPPFPASGDAFSFVSDPGDLIGQGKSETFTPPVWSFMVWQGNYDPGRVAIDVRSGEGINLVDWTIELASYGDNQLQVGTYTNVMRAAVRNNGLPGLDVSGDGRGCNQVFGSFTINQITYSADGQVRSLDATFVQHCESATFPALSGRIRYLTP